jgi:protein O-GlcNAc transferase
MAEVLASLSRQVGHVIGGGSALAGPRDAPLAHHARQALGLVQTGHLVEAEAVCRHLLAVQPRYFHALHLLGIIELQRGRHEQAAEWLHRAIAADSGHPQAFSNLAVALLAIKRPEEAYAHCRRAIALKPDFAEALANAADALCALNRRSEALLLYDKAIAASPSLIAAHYGRAGALLALQSLDAAVTGFEQALRINPTFVPAMVNRGNALFQLKRYDDALAAFDGALRLSPDFLEAINGRGCVLQALRRLPEALQCFEAALARNEHTPEAWFNQATVLLELGDYERSVECSARALALNSGYVAALNANANALWRLGRFAEAAEAYGQVVALDPEFPYAMGSHLNCRAQSCDWRDRFRLESDILLLNGQNKPAILPFALLSISDSAEAQLRCARTRVGDHPPPGPPLWCGERYRHDRIRLAYVSGDLGDHALSCLLAGVFEQHDREQFEITAISLRPRRHSDLGRRVYAAFDRFIDVSERSNRDTAQLMRDLAIDIAVDLAGHTGGARMEIFSHRPAPIQAAYLGFPATTGTAYMDYLIADEFLIPPEKARFYSENIVYLPHCFQANDDRRTISDRVPSRADEGLPQEAFVFCSFNASYKISPRFFDIWMRLLQRVPDAVLWLIGDDPATRDNLRHQARERGVDDQRLIFARRRPYDEHLARLQWADLFLDTLPFNAGTTASDCLWAGLPLLTCAGDALSARMAGSLLKAVGLPELITHTVEEYETRASHLASQRTELRALRDRLARNRHSSPLFDTRSFTRHLESAYIQMREGGSGTSAQ